MNGPLNEFFYQRMAILYGRMQGAYDEVASHYEGFSCMGCATNCCTQRFTHKTHAEYHYLMRGMGLLMQEAPGRASAMLDRAREVVAACAGEPAAPGPDAGPPALMCPVNEDGLCGLYEYRPMICRLHGLPHVFTMHGGRAAQGGGCGPFQSLADAPEFVLDRSSLYMELAVLENDFRVLMGLEGMLKKTTAQLLVDMAPAMERA